MECPVCDLDFAGFPDLEVAFVVHFLIDHNAPWDDKCPVCGEEPGSVMGLVSHVREVCGVKALASHIALEIMGGVYEDH